MKLSFIYLFLFLYFGAYAQKVSGTITDSVSGRTIEFVHISINKKDNTTLGTTSNEYGRYQLIGVESGERTLQFSFLGYETQQKVIKVPESNFGTITINIALVKKPIQAKQATITSRSLREPQSTLISKELFLRIPGAFNDPSRLAIKYAAVSSSDDQNNEIVVRGLAPHLSSWAINGANIVNPNHLSNAGTITDLSSASGGGTNMISGNSIHSYRFYSNPINNEFYNVLAGISSTTLEIPPGLSASIGLLGTEASYGYQGKIEAGINYRYSTLGTLSAFGLPLGDEKINFQDVHVRLAKKWKQHEFQFNSIVGNNSNVHESQGINSKFIRDALNVDFRSQQNIHAIQHRYLNNNIITKTAANFSSRNGSRESIVDPLFIELQSNQKSNKYNESLFSIKNTTTYFVNSTTDLFGTGIVDYSRGQYQNNTTNKNVSTLNLFLIGGVKNRIGNFTTKNSVGISSLSSNMFIELRSNSTIKFNQHKIAINYSRQATSIINELKSTISVLDPIHSNNLSFNYYITAKKVYLQLGAFYSTFDNIPVSPHLPISYFDNISLVKQAMQMDDFINYGIGKQYGVQTQFEYLLLNKIQFISAFSWYNLAVEKNNVQLNSSYNFNYTHANTISYSTALIKNNTLILGLSLSGRGAGYEQPIDLIGSIDDQETVYNLQASKERTLTPYTRLDAKVDYIFGKTNKDRISLDIQNATNRKNDAYYYYDALTNEITLRNQLGLIPIIKYTRKIL